MQYTENNINDNNATTTKTIETTHFSNIFVCVRVCVCVCVCARARVCVW